MSEPTAPRPGAGMVQRPSADELPPLPDPWAGPATEKRPRTGCGVPLLIGCGCLVMLVLAGGIALTVFGDELLELVIAGAASTIDKGLPEATSPEQRARLERAFDALPESLLAARLSVSEMGRVRDEILIAVQRAEAGTLTGEDVERLLVVLEELNPAAPGAEAPEPEPRRGEDIDA